MKYDDETLMAYADGELDEARRAEISAAMEADPDLARRVAQQRALRAEVAGAFATVMDQPVPDRLKNAARPPDARPRGNVVQFPSRGTRAPGAPWRAREWTAMAASLVLGGVLTWQFLERNTGDIGSRNGVVMAQGELARALDSQLASNQSPDATVHIGLSFKATDGAYCRSFIARSSSTAGLACREGNQWKLAVTTAVETGGEMRQATTLPPAVMQAVEARSGGEALDAAGEQSARDAGWK